MLRVESMSKSYGEHNVLHNIDFTCGNEIIALVGESGCGKTTLLKLLADLHTPSQGVIHGVSRVGMMFQQPALLPWRTVYENLNIVEELTNDTIELNKLLSMAGLDGYGKYYPHELSGGMQQRVALVRALSQKPDLLLLDEPFSAVDELMRDKLHKKFLTLWDKIKVPTILVTHSIPEAVLLADRVFIMKGKPAVIVEDIKINLPRSGRFNSKYSSQFIEHVRCIREKL